MIPSDSEDSADTPAPLFRRRLTTPPGLPWEQIRIARLEAINSSPVPIERASVTVRRTGGWRPRQPGVFEATYAHGLDATQRRAGPMAVASTAARRIPWPLVGLAALAIITTAFTFILAAGERGRRELRLEQVEQAARVRQRQLREAVAAAHAGEAVEAAGFSGQALGTVLDDLAWASRAKAASASLVHLSWSAQVLSVSARGREAPFATLDRTVVRAGPDAGATRWVVTRPRTEAALPTVPPSPPIGIIPPMPAPSPGTGHP